LQPAGDFSPPAAAHVPVKRQACHGQGAKVIKEIMIIRDQSIVRKVECEATYGSAPYS
jgi:hypothetical protein